MTWKELVSNIKTPIFIQDTYVFNNFGIVYPKNSEEVIFLWADEGYSGIEFTVSKNNVYYGEDFKGRFNLIDWFGEFELTKSHVCNCDLVTIIMRSGCQCGGK